MILPSKHVHQDQALIGVGAIVLSEMLHPHTVTSLWERARPHEQVGTFERFILALDMLYMIGAVEVTDGMIVRVTR